MEAEAEAEAVEAALKSTASTSLVPSLHIIRSLVRFQVRVVVDFGQQRRPVYHPDRRMTMLDLHFCSKVRYWFDVCEWIILRFKLWWETSKKQGYDYARPPLLLKGTGLIWCLCVDDLHFKIWRETSKKQGRIHGYRRRERVGRVSKKRLTKAFGQEH